MGIYGYSIALSRSFADYRDGLKPVMRRIITVLKDLNLTPNKPRVKVAKIVGDTMGSYHSHGDASIYDSLVRAGQDFSMQIPYIDKSGK